MTAACTTSISPERSAKKHTNSSGRLPSADWRTPVAPEPNRSPRLSTLRPTSAASRDTPLSIGTATFAISAVVLLLWIPLRERPGLGTVLNAVVIAVAIDVMLGWLPQPHANALRLVEVAGGIVAIGIGSALYLTTQLGPGPRDGWMTGIARHTNRSIAPVRLGIEISVLVIGFLLGGRAGLGTVLFALTIGQAVSTSITTLTHLADR